ncbi:cellobiose dehydrogenase [Staphylotrichum tortipilum]|uniref:Cellobiose dehydrogenase n=1 Tax=Staphylotrichum tortipilum TaxID=2831512 RepID=A0AAN6RSE9_9PEZI|nr:cellobiose dehydrogenase [Staphylotrichum longicolle]
MALKHIFLLALSGAQALAGITKRQSTTSSTTKYCPGGTQICFSQYEEPASGITYRIAIPEVSAAPFDILLQIVAPVDKAGWAAIAWGGKMNLNPLTVGWPNGNAAVVSSRWSTSRSVPGAYAGATYSVLPTTTTNATHWQLDVLCTGCSQWEGGSLNPSGVNTLGWAKNSKAVSSASSNTSSFGIHDGRGSFTHDFSAARIPKGIFDAIAYGLDNPSPVTSDPLPSLTTSTKAAVSTRLTQLPGSSSSSRLTQLPGSSTTRLPSTSPTPTSKPPTVIITTRITQLPPTTIYIPDPPITTTTRGGPITLTVTAQPPATTDDDGSGGGSGGVWLPPWGTGLPPWGKGKGKWGGRWGRGLAGEPREEE